jgi:hypothetical protein
VFEGVLDGFALRVEHSFLWRDDDFCFHAAQTKSAQIILYVAGECKLELAWLVGTSRCDVPARVIAGGTNANDASKPICSVA